LEERVEEDMKHNKFPKDGELFIFGKVIFTHNPICICVDEGEWNFTDKFGFVDATTLEKFWIYDTIFVRYLNEGFVKRVQTQ
jgi:hypothetical protein